MTNQLRRVALVARRRRGLWLAVGAGAAAHAAVVVALARRRVEAPSLPPPPQIVFLPTPPIVEPVVLPQPIVTVVPAPVAASSPFDDLGACPAEVTSAPRRAFHPPDATLTAVSPSRHDARLVVAWNGREIYESRDGGGAWARVLDGPGEVQHATFDCHGRLMAYRLGGAFGVRAGTQERWSDLDGFVEPAPGGPTDDDRRPAQVQLIGGGPRAAVLGMADDEGNVRLAISADAGDHWRFADLGWGEHDGLGAVMAPSGRIRVTLPWVDCMAEGMRIVAFDPDRGVVSDVDTDYMGDGAHPIAGGAVYGFAWGGADTPLRVWTGDAWRDVAWTDPDAEDGVSAALIMGPRPALWAGDRVWTLSGHRTKRLRQRWVADAAVHAVDRAGRIWGIDGHGTVVRR